MYWKMKKKKTECLYRDSLRAVAEIYNCIPVLLSMLLKFCFRLMMDMISHAIDRAVYKTLHCGNADNIQYIRLVMDLSSIEVYVCVCGRLDSRSF